jgi:hypothetical protein
VKTSVDDCSIVVNILANKIVMFNPQSPSTALDHLMLSAIVPAAKHRSHNLRQKFEKIVRTLFHTARRLVGRLSLVDTPMNNFAILGAARLA